MYRLKFLPTLLLVFLYGCAEVGAQKDEKKDVIPELKFKEERILQFAYLLNLSGDESLSSLSIAIPREIAKNLRFINRIQIPSDFQIISNREEILKSVDEARKNSAEKLGIVFRTTRGDFLNDQSFIPTAKPTTEADKNPPGSLGDKAKPAPASQGTSAPAATEGVKTSGDPKLDKALKTEGELTNRQAGDEEVIRLTAPPDIYLSEEIFAQHLKEFYNQKQLIKKLSIDSEALGKYEDPEIDNITNLDKTFGSSTADLILLIAISPPENAKLPETKTEKKAEGEGKVKSDKTKADGTKKKSEAKSKDEKKSEDGKTSDDAKDGEKEKVIDPDTNEEKVDVESFRPQNSKVSDKVRFQIRCYDKNKKAFLFKFDLDEIPVKSLLSYDDLKSYNRLLTETILKNILTIPTGTLKIAVDLKDRPDQNSVVYIDGVNAGETTKSDITCFNPPEWKLFGRRFGAIKNLIEPLTIVTAETRCADLDDLKPLKDITKDAWNVLKDHTISSMNIEYLPYGYHDVELVKEDFERTYGSIFVQENKNNFLMPTLNPIVRDRILYVDSTPPGAEVWLDLTYVGKTPLPKFKVQPRLYRVRVETEGYDPYFVSLDMATKKSAIVSASLRKTKEGEDFYTPENREIGLKRSKFFFIYACVTLVPIIMGSFLYDGIATDRREDTKDLTPTKYGGNGSASDAFKTPANTDAHEATLASLYAYYADPIKRGNHETFRTSLLGLFGVSLILAFVFEFLQLDSEDIKISQSQNLLLNTTIDQVTQIGYSFRF